MLPSRLSLFVFSLTASVGSLVMAPLALCAPASEARLPLSFGLDSPVCCPRFGVRGTRSVVSGALARRLAFSGLARSAGLAARLPHSPELLRDRYLGWLWFELASTLELVVLFHWGKNYPSKAP